MISAKELYRIIKEKYPRFRPPKAEPNNFSIPDKPPLDADQLELLENGFPVEPSYDPRFYPDSRIDPEHLDEIIQQFGKKRDHSKELYAEPEVLSTQDNAIT